MRPGRVLSVIGRKESKKRVSNPARLGEWVGSARSTAPLVGDPADEFNCGMNPEALAQELEREPFIPLRLRRSDGRTLDIRNPGQCFIARLGLYAFRARPHDTLAEDVEIISLRHIASVETIAPADRER